jgi:hypothetical protein
MWRLKLAMSKLKLSVREAREGLVDLSPGRAKFVAKPCASLDHQCPGERPKRGHGIHHLVLKTVMRQSQTCEHSQQSGPQMKDIQGGHRVLIFFPLLVSSAYMFTFALSIRSALSNSTRFAVPCEQNIFTEPRSPSMSSSNTHWVRRHVLLPGAIVAKLGHCLGCLEHRKPRKWHPESELHGESLMDIMDLV